MTTVILFTVGTVAFTFACKSLATYVSRRDAESSRRDSAGVPYARPQVD